MPRSGRKPVNKLTPLQKRRLMRVMTMCRKAILDALADEKLTPGEYVAKHKRHRDRVYSEFHYRDIDNHYVSDVTGRVARDMNRYVLDGTTPRRVHKG